MRITRPTVARIVGAASVLVGLLAGCKEIPKIADREDEGEREMRLKLPAAEVVGCQVAWRPVADSGSLALDAPAATVATSDQARPHSGGARPRAPQPGPDTAVRFETPTVVGGLDGAAVRRTVRRHEAEIERCYQQQLRRKPALAGTVNVQFTVDATGAVQAARTTGLDRDLDGCIAATVKAIQFPRPRAGAGAQVRYPITFHMTADPGVVLPSAGPGADPPPDPGVVHPNGGALVGLGWADDGVDAPLASWAERSVRAAVTTLVEPLGTCAGDAAGSARVRLGIDGGGKVIDLEVMGLGNASAEACLADQLARLIVTPPPTAVAVACDLQFGGSALPWRVTLHDDQPVIEVDESGAVLGDVRQPAGDDSYVALRTAVTAVRARTPSAVFLIRAASHASAGTLQSVVEILRDPPVPYQLGVVDEGGSLIRVSDTVSTGLTPPASPRPHIVGTLTVNRFVAIGPGNAELGRADPADQGALQAALEGAASCRDCARTVDLRVARDVEAGVVREVVESLWRAGLDQVILVSDTRSP